MAAGRRVVGYLAGAEVRAQFVHVHAEFTGGVSGAEDEGWRLDHVSTVAGWDRRREGKEPAAEGVRKSLEDPPTRPQGGQKSPAL